MALLDSDEWYRSGSGRRRELPDLPITLVGALLDALLEQYRPYGLIAHTLVPGVSGYRSHSMLVNPDDMNDLVDHGLRQYFIVSKLLSPELIEALPDISGGTLAINGALLLQVGLELPSGEIEAIELGITNRVATSNGEIIVHLEYDAIFRSAVRFASRLKG